jgi:predicted dehydrogenase
MFRIGIIGSDNSHALAFAKLVNFPDEKTGSYFFPDCRVTGIFGQESTRTEEVASKGNIDFIAVKPEELMGKVDAVMVVFRHGDLHLKYALPFVEKGIPIWIDKPFTIKNEDARMLIETAKKYHTPITGGSTTKYTADVMMVKNAVENSNSRIGRIKTAVMNFPAGLESEYGGISFYGPHLVEMTMQAFGYNPISVLASENNGCVAAIVQYENYQVTMNFIPDNHEYYAVLFGEKGTFIREIDIGGSYLNGFEKFAGMLRTSKMPEPFENLYAPVELLNAVVESYTNNTGVKLKGL